MSTKVLHSLKDENQDLHKQVGCMNGMFQLFNRRHFLTGQRSSSHKRLLQGQSGNHGIEPDGTMQKTTETNPDEIVKEKRRVSVESSRISFSSSCSSTFTSIDCNKTDKPEQSSLCHSNFLETPSQLLSKKRPISSPNLRQQSLDLRDVVKDSIKRETQGLSVKTTPKAERTNHVLKHIDSPRPLQPFKPVKTKDYGLDGSVPLKDSHRFSYDGRESRETWKSTLKIKETPRLSLDSRESSIRRSASESRSNYLLENLERRNVESSQTLNPRQEPASNKRTSGVLTKLMGLEAFPDSTAANNDQMRKIKCYADDNLNAMSTTSTKSDESKHNQFSSSPRTPQRKPVSSPGSRSNDSVLKPNSGFPLEQAPWRKAEGNGNFEKPPLVYQEAQVQTNTIQHENLVQKTRNSGSSVIPIEGMLGLRKLRTSENANNKDSVQKQSLNHLTRRNSYFREPSCQTLSSSTDKSSNAKTSKSIQTSKAPHNTSRGDYSSTGRSSKTVSPRWKQKQHGMEKQSRPNTQISDSSRSRKQLSKQQTESGSPGRKSKPKSMIELSREPKQLSHQCDAISVQSETNITSALQIDVEVNEIYGAHNHESQRNNIQVRLRSETATAILEQPSPVSVLDTTFYREGSPSPVKKTSNTFKDESQDFDEAEWNQEDLRDLLNSTGRKQAIDFGPEKSETIEHLVNKLGQVNLTQDEPAMDNISSFCESTNPDHRYVTEMLLASGLLFKDLASSLTFIQLHPSGHLISPSLLFLLEQTKRRIDLSDDQWTNEKIDHSKICEKIHRKLMFDTVNEILVGKLSSAGYSEAWICPSNMGVKTLTGQQLLKELCSEVDQLQAKPNSSMHDEDDGLRGILNENTMYKTPIGEDFLSEIPGIVLDIERLIFKDLISEVLKGEVACHPGRPATNCKRLFPD